MSCEVFLQFFSAGELLFFLKVFFWVRFRLWFVLFGGGYWLFFSFLVGFLLCWVFIWGIVVVSKWIVCLVVSLGCLLFFFGGGVEVVRWSYSGNDVGFIVVWYSVACCCYSDFSGHGECFYSAFPAVQGAYCSDGGAKYKPYYRSIPIHLQNLDLLNPRKK